MHVCILCVWKLWKCAINLYIHACSDVSDVAYQSWILYFFTEMSSSSVCTLPLKGEGHLSVSKQICIQCHIWSENDAMKAIIYICTGQ